MAAEKKQRIAASGNHPAPCADRCCLFFSGTPMCSRCYAEKVLKPMEELEAALDAIRRANSGKKHAPATATITEARNVASSRCGGACLTKKAGVRNCS